MTATKQSLQATDQWVLENQSKFTAAMALINQMLTPEQQLKKELDRVTEELTIIYSTMPAAEAAKPATTLSI